MDEINVKAWLKLVECHSLLAAGLQKVSDLASGGKERAAKA